jgi:hypothetical protein
MQDIFIHFLGIVAFNSAYSVFTFLIAFYIRRKSRPISWVRGALVFFYGWVLGSWIIFLIHLASAYGGFEIENSGPIEAVIPLAVMLPTMFILLDFFKGKSN